MSEWLECCVNIKTAAVTSLKIFFDWLFCVLTADVNLSLHLNNLCCHHIKKEGNYLHTHPLIRLPSHWQLCVVIISTISIY